jgi:sterol desaturase/sphingolipid hydroxylase (fatty acid hydroxylase superfamily)
LVKFDTVPVRGKHLDEFTRKDKIFVAISKLQTGPFVYFLLRYALSEPNLLWSLQEMTWKTVLLPIPVLFIVFDFFYTTMHWALHIKAIYGFIHKHHHTQKAPSRANEDAINVHPIEFVLGEYNHLWSLFLCCRLFHLPVHMAAVGAFLSIGAVLAGWNHTRYDIVFSLFGYTLFDSKAHDVHHRIPQSNYGQYTMFWDHVFGTFRDYDPNDRVNPKAQLDPKTGKSLEYMDSQQIKSD